MILYRQSFPPTVMCMTTMSKTDSNCVFPNMKKMRRGVATKYLIFFYITYMVSEIRFRYWGIGMTTALHTGAKWQRQLQDGSWTEARRSCQCRGRGGAWQLIQGVWGELQGSSTIPSKRWQGCDCSRRTTLPLLSSLCTFLDEKFRTQSSPFNPIPISGSNAFSILDYIIWWRILGIPRAFTPIGFWDEEYLWGVLEP
jgi:hypothetical protein